MKLGPVTKSDKRNKTMSKKFNDDIKPENYGAIVIFSIYGQYRDTWKPNSGGPFYNTYIFIKTFSYKN